MIFLSLLGCTLIFLFNRPKQNVLLDPLTLFFVGLLYYGFFIPVTMTLFGRYELAFLNSFIDVSDSEITKISAILFFGYAAFVLGYRVFTRRSYVDASYNIGKRTIYLWNDRGGHILVFMLFAALAICLLFFRPQLIAVFSGYEGKILTRYEASTFALVYGLALMVASALMARLILFGRNYVLYAALSVAFLFAWALLTFSKEPMVFGALVLFAAAARFAPRRQLAIFGAAVVVGVAVLIFFVPSFSQYRATGQLVFVDPRHIALTYLFSDAGGPFPAFVLAVRGGEVIDLNPLWQSVLLWIPRGVWPDRPWDAAEDFARAVMPGWRPGYGLGFSPFAEGRIRFGMLLSPVLLFLSGLSISGLQRLAIRLVPPTLATALLLVIQGYIMFVMHRGAFSGIFTATAQFWIPFLTLTGIFSLVLWAGRARR